jgi:hypothetical protein
MNHEPKRPAVKMNQPLEAHLNPAVNHIALAHGVMPDETAA